VNLTGFFCCPSGPSGGEVWKAVVYAELISQV
jgi:hypothetical protein